MQFTVLKSVKTELFFTDTETVDNARFISLGVIKNQIRHEMQKIDEIVYKLQSLFDSGNVTKAGVVNIMREWLPDFDHIERGRGLDSKM